MLTKPHTNFICVIYVLSLINTWVLICWVHFLTHWSLKSVTMACSGKKKPLNISFGKLKMFRGLRVFWGILRDYY